MSAPPRYPAPYGSTFKRRETDDEFKARIRATKGAVEVIVVKTVTPRRDGEDVFKWKAREQKPGESDYAFWHRHDAGESVALRYLVGDHVPGGKLDEYVWQAFGMQRKIIEDEA